MAQPSFTSPARRFLALIIISLVMTGVFGLFWEIHLLPARSASRTHEDGRLSTLVPVEGNRLTQLFGLATALHDVARDGTVVVPDDATPNYLLWENLAQVHITTEDYDPVLQYDPTDILVSNPTLHGIGVIGSIEDTAPWVVVWKDGSGTPRSLRYFTRKTKVILMDERLLETP